MKTINNDLDFIYKQRKTVKKHNCPHGNCTDPYEVFFLNLMFYDNSIYMVYKTSFYPPLYYTSRDTIVVVFVEPAYDR